MSLSKETILDALKTVKYPGFSRDIVSFGLVKEVVVEGNSVKVTISLATADAAVPEAIYKEAKETLHAVKGVGPVDLEFDIKAPAEGGQARHQSLENSEIPGVKRIIAVASGKGGVGKSTIASNLAVALQKSGARTGLCDCDLYGPSVAHMFGSDERPAATHDNRIIPIEAGGLKLMSMGFLLDDQSPVIVRGPMATRYTQQFLRQVEWGELDYLILDLPPGTGDIQLTIVQTVAVSGAIIVTTPQEVALIDARKASSMFAKVNVPVLGIVENMSFFVCPSDDQVYHIFGKGGGQAEADRLGVPLLGEVPIDMATRERADAGSPIALDRSADSPVSAVFEKLAGTVKEMVPTTDG
ncbi:MAG: Mrp/NBP35 family ATP-binding protein [Verrucomicrobiota bacterium]